MFKEGIKKGNIKLGQAVRKDFYYIERYIECNYKQFDLTIQYAYDQHTQSRMNSIEYRCTCSATGDNANCCSPHILTDNHLSANISQPLSTDSQSRFSISTPLEPNNLIALNRKSKSTHVLWIKCDCEP